MRFILIGLLIGIITFITTSIKAQQDIEVEKIKTIASIISVIGASLIYFTIRSYNIN